MSNRKTPSTRNRFEHDPDSYSLGPDYLEYCVHKGWLEKVGKEPAVQYIMTEAGKKKLSRTHLNFDLSTIIAKGDEPKRKRRRHKT